MISLNKKKKKEIPLPFDIIYKTNEKLNLLRSQFGCESFCRLIANIIIPGSGTMSLICKYNNFKCEIFFTGFLQFIGGGFFFLSIILLIFQVPIIFSFFYESFFSMYKDEININFF